MNNKASQNELTVNFYEDCCFDEINDKIKLSVKEAVKKTLDCEKFPYSAEVSVTFVTEDEIRRLNNEYRGKDLVTDVLSFPLYDDGDFSSEEFTKYALLGDIVICVNRAAEQAAVIGNSLEREICFLAVHSTLHLLGYDHERSEDEDKLQCEKQKDIINSMEF